LQRGEGSTKSASQVVDLGLVVEHVFLKEATRVF
jgi:hypothetical protein